MFEKIRNRLDFRGAVLDLLKFSGLNFLNGSHWWETSGIDRKLVSYIHSGEMEKTAKGWMFDHNSRKAAIDHVDRVYRAYANQTNTLNIPIDFTIIMDNITKYQNVEIPEFWKTEIKVRLELAEKYKVDQKSRLPKILKARAAAKGFLTEATDAIYNEEIGSDVWEIWDATSGAPKSEWEIHVESGVSIEEVCKWVFVFSTYGLIESEFPHAVEPAYSRPFFPPEVKDKLDVYEAFMNCEDFR